MNTTANFSKRERTLFFRFHTTLHTDLKIKQGLLDFPADVHTDALAGSCCRREYSRAACGLA